MCNIRQYYLSYFYRSIIIVVILVIILVNILKRKNIYRWKQFFIKTIKKFNESVGAVQACLHKWKTFMLIQISVVDHFYSTEMI